MLLTLSAKTQAEFSVTWNGFGTIGLAAVSDASVSDQGFVRYNDFRESFNEQIDTRFGVQGNFSFTQKISATLQLSSKAKNDYQIKPEWAYFTFQISPNLKLRAGRLRRSIYQYSDFFDVGYAYSWVRPPSITYFDLPPMYAPINAADLFYQKAIGKWNFSTQTYVGGNGGKDRLSGRDIYYYEREPYGTTLELQNNRFQFRLGYHKTLFSVIVDEIVDAQNVLSQLGFNEIAQTLSLEDTASEFISLSAVANLGSLKVGGEYAITNTKETIQPEVDSWHVGVEKNFGLYTFYYSYGQQNVRGESDVIQQIDAAQESISQNSDAGSQFASTALSSISDVLEAYILDGQSKRSTNLLGIRYDFRSSFALKAEYELLNDLRNHRSANIFSISLDFMY